MSRHNMGHPDLDELLNAVVSTAQMLLKEQGEFYPIGAMMLADGEIRTVGLADEHYPQAHIDLLTETFQKEAAKGKLRAAATCLDVLTVPPGKDQKQDAIFCGLEHCLGESLDAFIPYFRTTDGNFQYDEIYAGRRTPQFFTQMPRC